MRRAMVTADGDCVKRSLVTQPASASDDAEVGGDEVGGGDAAEEDRLAAAERDQGAAAGRMAVVLDHEEVGGEGVAHADRILRIVEPDDGIVAEIAAAEIETLPAPRER